MIILHVTILMEKQYSNSETSYHSTMNSSQSDFKKRAKIERESGTFSSIKKIFVYDFVFEQHFIDYDIYFEEHDDDEGSEKSTNIKDIYRRLAQFRFFLSFSRFIRKNFLNFKKKNRNVLIENIVMSKAFSIVIEKIDIFFQENFYFENFKNFIDHFIIKAKPNFYDEVRSAKLNKQIRKQLSEYIESSIKKNASLLTNFFAEVKSSNDETFVNELQTMYDGIIDARKIHEFRSYVNSNTTFDKVEMIRLKISETSITHK